MENYIPRGVRYFEPFFYILSRLLCVRYERNGLGATIYTKQVQQSRPYLPPISTAEEEEEEGANM